MSDLDWATCRVCCCPYPVGEQCPRSHTMPDTDTWAVLLAEHLPDAE